MAVQEYEAEQPQLPSKPNLTLIEGAQAPVDIASGPYDVYEGQLENHFLPIVVGKGEQVVGTGSATFNSTGASAQVGEFTLSAEADEQQVFSDVIDGLLANEHLQQLEVRPKSAEEMAAKMTLPPPEGWDKTTSEKPSKNEFHIRFIRNHDAYNQHWMNVNQRFIRLASDQQL